MRILRTGSIQLFSIQRCVAEQTKFLGGWFAREKPLIYSPVAGRHIHLGSTLPYSSLVREEGKLSIQKTWFMKEQRMQIFQTSILQTPQIATITKDKQQQPVIYRGPFSDTLRKVKMLSITSCCLSVITGPAITFLTSPQLSVILKGGISTVVILLSASTTAALHWFVGPYVHKMTWVPGAANIEVEMITWMATYDKKVIAIEDIRPPKTNRPFVSFAVKDKFYFVDAEKIPNKDLNRIVTFYHNKK